MKFGTPLHVAIANKDFKNGCKILKMFKSSNSTSFLTRVDEDDNTVMHMVMKNFNTDIAASRKIASTLLAMGASLKDRNRIQMTPLAHAMFYN
jgi:hypothetical protein